MSRAQFDVDGDQNDEVELIVNLNPRLPTEISDQDDEVEWIENPNPKSPSETIDLTLDRDVYYPWRDSIVQYKATKLALERAGEAAQKAKLNDLLSTILDLRNTVSLYADEFTVVKEGMLTCGLCHKTYTKSHKNSKGHRIQVARQRVIDAAMSKDGPIAPTTSSTNPNPKVTTTPVVAVLTKPTSTKPGEVTVGQLERNKRFATAFGIQPSAYKPVPDSGRFYGSDGREGGNRGGRAGGEEDDPFRVELQVGAYSTELLRFARDNKQLVYQLERRWCELVADR
ncbi:hypothetical protein TrRE_jg1054 [Triparma retinervis]|uniref:Uncharacterized protein n=1 Tax=Triparma retinervis TaxID=2557542 RepID=A0A9W7KSD0_9STRA|nr:hypothetical protein TrRE_jg1054 [Triparma retinervis]